VTGAAAAPRAPPAVQFTTALRGSRHERQLQGARGDRKRGGAMPWRVRQPWRTGAPAGLESSPGGSRCSRTSSWRSNSVRVERRRQQRRVRRGHAGDEFDRRRQLLGMSNAGAHDVEGVRGPVALVDVGAGGTGMHVRDIAAGHVRARRSPPRTCKRGGSCPAARRRDSQSLSPRCGAPRYRRQQVPGWPTSARHGAAYTAESTGNAVIRTRNAPQRNARRR
jgi:hypothetical protein